jgi:hypothetical protein
MWGLAFEHHENRMPIRTQQRVIRLAEGRPLAGRLGIDPDRHI